MDLRESLTSGLQALEQGDLDDRIDQFLLLIDELRKWNARINLTAVRKPADMIGLHLLDSLAVRPWLRGKRIIDIGTGAGFPGLPLALAEPDRQFVLLDSNGKKISFVRHAASALGIDNVHAVKARVEDYAPDERFDTVIARALATVPRLVELSAHLVGEGGQLLALKGKSPLAELDAAGPHAAWEYQIEQLAVPTLDAHSRHLVRLQRNCPLP